MLEARTTDDGDEMVIHDTPCLSFRLYQLYNNSTYNTPGQVIAVNLTTFTEVGNLTLPLGMNLLTAALLGNLTYTVNQTDPVSLAWELVTYASDVGYFG